MANFAPFDRSNRGMESGLVRFVAALLLAMLAACAAEPETRTDDAMADFIGVSELEEASKATMRQQFALTEITDRYVVLKAHKDHYLVEFRHRCYARDGGEITPDIRRERNVLRPGVDTIRGCRIGRIFVIDEAQAQELQQLGKTLRD